MEYVLKEINENGVHVYQDIDFEAIDKRSKERLNAYLEEITPSNILVSYNPLGAPSVCALSGLPLIGEACISGSLGFFLDGNPDKPIHPAIAFKKGFTMDRQIFNELSFYFSQSMLSGERPTSVNI